MVYCAFKEAKEAIKKGYKKAKMKFFIKNLKTKALFIRIDKDDGVWWTLLEKEAKAFKSYEEAFNMGVELCDMGYDDLIIY